MPNRDGGPKIALPHDFLTHRESWRSALEGMRDKDPDNRAYWEHELRAYDRAHEELADQQAKADQAAAKEGGDLRSALETAYRRLGGIPALARSEGGAKKIIEIALREFAAAIAKPIGQPTAWMRLTGQHLTTTDQGIVDLWMESGAVVLPLFGGERDVPLLARQALDNSSSLLSAMLHEPRPTADIEDQINENRKSLTAL